MSEVISERYTLHCDGRPNHAPANGGLVPSPPLVHTLKIRRFTLGKICLDDPGDQTTFPTIIWDLQELQGWMGNPEEESQRGWVDTAAAN